VKSKISFALFIFLIASILLLITSRFNNDGWFLLNSGRYVENFGIPHTEPFTIHEGFHFVMQQWLFALGLWKIYEIGQMQGVLLFTWAMGAVFIFVFYKLLQLVDSHDTAVSRIMTVGAAALMSVYFTQRPQIVSGFIFLIEIYVLEYLKDKERPPWTIYGLFFILSALLINFHAAMWPMLSVFILPYLAESIFGARIPWFRHSFLWKWKYTALLWIPILIAGFMNPYGIESMTYAFHSYGYEEINSLITEMRPLSLGSNSYASIILSIILMLTVIYARNPLPLHWILLFAGTAFMALLAIRSIFLFLIAGLFPLAFILHRFSFKKTESKATTWKRTWPMMILMSLAATVGLLFILEKYTIPPDKLVLIITIICFLLLLSLFYAYILWKERNRQNEIRANARNLFFTLVLLLLTPLFYLYYDIPLVNPALKKSIEVIQEDAAGRPVSLWTGYNEGPYAEFHGFPCYIDARAEVFLPKLNHKKDVFSEYVSLRDGLLDYRDFMKRYHFTHLLTTTNDILYTYLKNDKDYILLWDSDTDDSISAEERKNLKEKYRVYKYQPK
jgi:hypothetical protein